MEDIASRHKIILAVFLVIIIGLLIYNKYYNSSSNEHFNGANKPTIYNFNMSTCPHCINFKPIWNKFHETIKNKNINVFDVQCDSATNSDTCRMYQINSVPTVVLEYVDTNGNVVRKIFNDSRTVENLVSFVTPYI